MSAITARARSLQPIYRVKTGTTCFRTNRSSTPSSVGSSITASRSTSKVRRCARPSPRRLPRHPLRPRPNHQLAEPLPRSSHQPLRDDPARHAAGTLRFLSPPAPPSPSHTALLTTAHLLG